MSDRVETAKQLARRVGISEYQIRKLIYTGQLEHVKIGYRLHIPVGGWERFIEANKKGGELWLDETKAQSSVGLQRVTPTISPGHSTVAAASVRLAQQIARRLKRSSPNGSMSEDGKLAQVIPLP
jgi:hypothetical protein